MPDDPMTKTGRRTGAIDRHVGARIRARRVMLGLSQRRMAGLLGVPCQQPYKYERGVHRITAGRLHAVARALDVEVGHFFGELGEGPAEPVPRRLAVLGFARAFAALPSRRQQEALAALARALADPDQGPEPEPGRGVVPDAAD